MDWETFISAFGLVFVAELGDKTQLAVVTQACKYRRPWAVFLGASAALGAVTALGVIGGRVLDRLIPADLLQIAAALAFVVMGVFIAREAYRCGDEVWGEDSCAVDSGEPGDDRKGGASSAIGGRHALAATFGLLFLAELGDKTQLAVLSLSSERGDGWAVLGGGATALIVVTALGVIGGRVLCELVPRRLLLWLSAAVFFVMGLLMGFGGI